jgi:hypothetical protein
LIAGAGVCVCFLAVCAVGCGVVGFVIVCVLDILFWAGLCIMLFSFCLFLCFFLFQWLWVGSCNLALLAMGVCSSLEF